MTTLQTDRALPENLPSWGVLVLESHHSARFTMQWRTHSFAKIVYVLSGQGMFYLGENEELFAEGDVIVVPPGTPNRIVDDPTSAASLYICCITPSLLSFDPSLVAQLPCRVLGRDSHFANRVASALRRMFHAQQSDATNRSVSMVADAMRLVQYVLEKSCKSRRSGKDSTDDRQLVKQYVESLPSLFFDETSIDTAASSLEIPRRTFTKLFAEIAGETWLQRVRRLAIEHAQRRLSESDVPITSIAFECGFNDLSTFYRQFRRHCDLSPGEYLTREQFRGS